MLEFFFIAKNLSTKTGRRGQSKKFFDARRRARPPFIYGEMPEMTFVLKFGVERLQTFFVKEGTPAFKIPPFGFFR
jgi:hypothetical protein